MAVADQRLEADHAPVGGGDDRLQAEQEVALAVARAQALAQRPAGVERLADAVAVPARAAPAALLGGVHRRVGAGQQGLRVVAVVRRDRDPDAGRDLARRAVELDRDLEQLDEALRRVGDLGLVPHDVDDGQELVAPDPADHVAAPQRLAHRARRAAQRAVAVGVAEGVVDGLEAVQVDVEHADRAAGPAGAVERLVEVLQGRDPVGQAGQAVHPRHGGQRAS